MARGLTYRREIDRAIGAPLLFLAGVVFRKRTAPPSSVSRILILQNPTIGDTILQTGPLGEIRNAYPDAHITMLMGPDNISIKDLVKSVDEFIDFGYTNPMKVISWLGKTKFDMVIDFGTWPRINAIYALIARSRFTIGFSTPKQYRHYAYDRWVEHGNDVHELVNQRRLVQSLLSPHPLKQISPHIEIGASADLPDEIAPFVVFHPWASGTGKRLKEWPSARWAELTELLLESGLAIAITGGPLDAQDTASLIDYIKTLHPTANLINYAGKLKLTGALDLIRRSKGIVSVNTGIMHAAAALDTPTIGLCGPTNSVRWGPIGDRCIAVAPKSGTFGYLNLGFEFPRHAEPCMPLIEASAVRDAMEQLAII